MNKIRQESLNSTPNQFCIRLLSDKILMQNPSSLKLFGIGILYLMLTTLDLVFDYVVDTNGGWNIKFCVFGARLHSWRYWCLIISTQLKDLSKAKLKETHIYSYCFGVRLSGINIIRFFFSSRILEYFCHGFVGFLLFSCTYIFHPQCLSLSLHLYTLSDIQTAIPL